MKRDNFLIIILAILLINPLITAAVGYGQSDYGVHFETPEEVFDNNTAYVNSTDWWIIDQGPVNTANSTEFTGFSNQLNIDLSWLNQAIIDQGTLNFLSLSGNNANQNIDIGIFNFSASNFFGNLNATFVQIALGGGSPTIDQLQEYLDNTGSSGFFLGGELSDGGAGTLDISIGSGFIRTTNDKNAELQSFKWDAVSGMAVTDDTTQYVYVDDDGVISLSQNEFLERPDLIQIGVVVKESGIIQHTFKLGVRLEDSIGEAGRFLRRVLGISRNNRLGGLILGQSSDANRDVTMTAGQLEWGRTSYIITSFDTSGADTFSTYSASGEENPTASQWNNTHYDNSGTLTEMTNNRWANHFVYLEPDDHIVFVFGREQFVTQAQAENEGVPSSSLPTRITETSILIGRFTFKKSEDIAIVSTNFPAGQFNSAGVTDHGNLAGLIDDDHVQYILADGTRAWTGNENGGGFNSTNWNAGSFNNISVATLDNGGSPIVVNDDVDLGSNILKVDEIQDSSGAGINITVTEDITGFRIKNNVGNTLMSASSGVSGLFRFITFGESSNPLARVTFEADETEFGNELNLKNQIDGEARIAWFTGTSGDNHLVFFESDIYPEDQGVGKPDLNLGRVGDEFNNLNLKGTIDLGTNTIFDGGWTGNWDANNDSITNLSSIFSGNGLWNITSGGFFQGDGSQLTGISHFNQTYQDKADYQFTNNNFNGSGNLTTTGDVTANSFRAGYEQTMTVDEETITHTGQNTVAIIISGDPDPLTLGSTNPVFSDGTQVGQVMVVEVVAFGDFDAATLTIKDDLANGNVRLNGDKVFDSNGNDYASDILIVMWNGDEWIEVYRNLGRQNDFSGKDSGWGFNNEFSGLNAGWGSSNDFTGDYAGWGNNNEFSGNYAGWGRNHDFTGLYAGGMGLGNIATHTQAVFGRFATEQGSLTAWTATDDLFKIGIGTGSGSRADALRILKNGESHWETDSKHYYGQNNDASFYYNNTDFVINPKEAGTGKLFVLGDLVATENVTSGDRIFLGNGVSIGFNATCKKITYDSDGSILSAEFCS